MTVVGDANGYAFTATAQVLAAASCVGGAVVTGVAILDTSGATNHVTVYDGTSSSGTVIASFDCAASSSAGGDFTHGRVARSGVYVTCTGACKGAVWIG